MKCHVDSKYGRHSGVMSVYIEVLLVIEIPITIGCFSCQRILILTSVVRPTCGTKTPTGKIMSKAEREDRRAALVDAERCTDRAED